MDTNTIPQPEGFFIHRITRRGSGLRFRGAECHFAAPSRPPALVRQGKMLDCRPAGGVT